MATTTKERNAMNPYNRPLNKESESILDNDLWNPVDLTYEEWLEHYSINEDVDIDHDHSMDF